MKRRSGVFIVGETSPRLLIRSLFQLGINKFRIAAPLVPSVINKLIYSALAVTGSTG